MSKWDRAFYRYQMPTVGIIILWDWAACCFQIARILNIFAAVYKWNIQFAATSDVCHCYYSAALCFVCRLTLVQYVLVKFMYVDVNIIIFPQHHNYRCTCSYLQKCVYKYTLYKSVI